MKRIILLACFVSLTSLTTFASGTKDKEVIAAYQELCAKEHDPVKRENYCYMLENSSRSHTNANVFRQDTAVV